MAIRFAFNIVVQRAPQIRKPNGEDPGWYVVDRDKIVATCDTREEAGRVAEDFSRMWDRVGAEPGP